MRGGKQNEQKSDKNKLVINMNWKKQDFFFKTSFIAIIVILITFFISFLLFGVHIYMIIGFLNLFVFIMFALSYYKR